MKKSFFCFILILTGYSKTFAQKNPREHISGFNMMSFTYKLESPYFLYLELQNRSIEDYSYPDYYEVKGGLGYTFENGHQPFIGIGRYATYRDKKIAQEELRLWLQYIYSHKLSGFKIDHRLRAEQRFFHDVKSGNDTQDQRYRYRMNISKGLNKDKIEEGTVFALFFEELFFGKNEPIFKRNRMLGGIGYQITDKTSAIGGYMWQREFNQTPIRNLHFLYFSVNFVLGKSKPSGMFPIQVAD